MSEERRYFARKRRENVKGGRTHTHYVKVSAEEEGVLARLAAAQHVTIPRLLVESAMASEQGGETPTERRQLLTELFRLHRLLATVANNMNQVARVTNTNGTAPADLPAAIVEVRETAQLIDTVLDGLAMR